jgi:hypothetical protein
MSIRPKQFPRVRAGPRGVPTPTRRLRPEASAGIASSALRPFESDRSTPHPRRDLGASDLSPRDAKGHLLELALRGDHGDAVLDHEVEESCDGDPLVAVDEGVSLAEVKR